MQYLIGPVAILVVGFFLNRSSKSRTASFREENASDHAKVRDVLGSVIDGQHNLTRRVDGVQRSVDGVDVKLDKHLEGHK